MKPIFTILLFSFSLLTAQETGKWFYATMNLQDAYELQKDFPREIELLKSVGNEVAVYMSEEVSHELHGRVLVHGPGYIYRNSKENAIKNLTTSVKSSPKVNFSITEDATVNAAMNAINTQNIEDHILELQNYGTRYHTRANATQSAEDLKVKWETMAANYGRTDVSVRLYNHTNTGMPSVIMTITGTEIPDDYVVVGGHLDSTSSQGNDNAPGADDDASGIATITEAVRALFEIDFKPRRTIEVMAYAAEEVGLVGSTEIAQEYSTNDINVIAVSQFDMTNYQGSGNDVYFIEDNTDASLNSFFKQLIDHYNASGTHQLTYGTAFCNYGCSDHASWHREGFKATFPFEASFSSYNPNIHTANDTFSISGTANHATKFAKLCTEFLIEIAKSDESLSVNDFEQAGYTLYTANRTLIYTAESSSPQLTNIILFDMQGKTILKENDLDRSGAIALQAISPGIYIVAANLEGGKTIYKKLVVN
ncbi:M20/M25/M40 family metallo-hydrolase [Aquimarina brevivitae]|uniref:Leucyl aminopeptidase n=1 Tax=Aquimarina brevivitae TaxID=323412 RepID=A0A4Q7PMS0_9FLAO|nr:M20/M25/M40 family metallo-hydrolase [Aquimarina brevivitae]RZT00333.1 leucyl aminopeptidase [Aquimarina brevivitae]